MNSINKDIKSQIERAKKLFGELKISCERDLKSKSISDDTKNLTPEILLKMRNLLDQSLYGFFEKNIAPKLSEKDKDKDKARIYFPITAKKENLKSILGRGKMTNLETDHPKVFNFLDSIQPYNKGYEWLGEFNELAGQKHIKLLPQKMEKKVETILGGAVKVTGKGVAMRGCKVQGIPVDSEDINSTPLSQFDPRLSAERTIWVSFNFADTGTNILWLCEKAINDLEEIIKDFFKLF